MCLWFLRTPLLAGAAALWVIHDPLEPADAIVMLPQAGLSPVWEAVRLHRAGLASRVVLVRSKLRPTDRAGLTQPYHEGHRRQMLDRGVPESDIVLVGEETASLFEASKAVRMWAVQSGARRLRLVTEAFATRRVCWALQRATSDLALTLRLHATPVPDYPVNEWWRHEQGLIHFENEVVLWLYYRLTH